MKEVNNTYIPDEHIDEDLQKMIRFEDLTAGKTDRTKVYCPEASTDEWENADYETAVDDTTEQWHFPRKLVACGKWALAFGGIQAVLFWWLQAGLLASEAAWPGMVVCALLGGLTVGWNAK